MNVLDAPGKPIGPLSATDISGDAMTLHWSPPLDDGGGHVTNYVVEKKEPNGTWVKVGQPIGTSFRVRNLENGKPYEFRVSAENQYGVGEPLQTIEPIIAKNPFSKYFYYNFLPILKKGKYLKVAVGSYDSLYCLTFDDTPPKLQKL